MREGQANDELHGVRMALGEKSFLFRKDVRLAQSKFKKGRAWSKVKGVSRRVQAHRQVYNAARAAMVELGCPVDMLARYQVLHRDQLKVSTAAMRGGSQQQNEPLAWFWTMNVQADIEASDMLKDCKSFSLCQASPHYHLHSLQGALVEGKCQARKMVRGVVHYQS